MARVNSIDLLPEDVRAELAAGLKSSGWGNIDRWTEWLTERGYEISRTTVGNFNKVSKERFKQAWADAEQTAAMAKLLVANKESDGGATLAANEILASDGLLRMQLMLRDLEALADGMESAEDATGLKIELAKLQGRFSRSVADLNKAGIARAKWQEEVNKKIEATMARLESQAAGGAGAGKLDADTLAAVRREIYGLVG
jgi:hypothetical protein